jgi:NCAIR mutase (PurE)-related protein
VRPFDALRERLGRRSDISQEEYVDGAVAGEALGGLRLDHGRRLRTGIPEVVLAARKPPETVVAALVELAGANGRAVASRCEAAHFEALAVGLPEGFSFEAHREASAVVVVWEVHEGASVSPTGGLVGILAAGNSDGRMAAEAALIAEEMGCRVVQARDVGVAGIHRLVAPLEAMASAGVDALIVAAGMDGALPSVVAGLVDVPVIGLPTSIGYGMGGAGEAALLAMLQSCAPGLVVVNIDNGIGAGAAAARIANRAAAARFSGHQGVDGDGITR